MTVIDRSTQRDEPLTSRYINSSISHMISSADKGFVGSNSSSLSGSKAVHPLSILGSPIYEIVKVRGQLALVLPTSKALTASNNVKCSSLTSLPAANSAPAVSLEEVHSEGQQT
jgi:hypothetical protein